jgi:hypothetical protein
MNSDPRPQTPDPSFSHIDYEAAAEQLLAVLSERAATAGVGGSPIGAADLCLQVFGSQADHWSHETRRRRIRDTAKLAREQLAAARVGAQVLANGQGYWIDTEPATIAHYAANRRSQGLQDLAAASQVKGNVAPAAGQSALFAEPEMQRRIRVD